MVFGWGRRPGGQGRVDTSNEAGVIEYIGSDGEPRIGRLASLPDDDDMAAAAAAVKAPPDDDEIARRFGRTYPADILDELRTYERPPWQEEASSLDPVDDLTDHYAHDFSLPPPVHDAVQEVAARDVQALRALKAPLDPAHRARIEERQRLVEVRLRRWWRVGWPAGTRRPWA